MDGAGVVVHVVHAGQPGHLAECRVVRPRHPYQQVGDGYGHGQQHAIQNVEHKDACARGQRDHQFAAAEGEQPPERTTSMSRMAA